jgi:hypothetical protein
MNMTVYKIWQINLTDEEIVIINGMGHGAVPKNVLRLRVDIADDKQTLVAEAFEKGYYEHVANITADSLEGVFRVGNIGPEENIERFLPMHSVSVGDVVEDKNGVRHVVADFGFEEII